MTDTRTWDRFYESRGDGPPPPFVANHWREYASTQVMRRLEAIGLAGKRVLEVGGGDSAMLAWLARSYPTASFAALDSSTVGCQRLRERAGHEQVTIQVIEGDVFHSMESLAGSFDVVFSFGLVEHFVEVADILAAKCRLLKPGGTMFTLVPNLSSPLLRHLMRRWSPTVHAMHVQHDPRSLADGHRRAGLSVSECGHIAATEFGVLSIAADELDHGSLDYRTYLWLTRFSKLIHLFERYAFDLPASRLLSPFVYAIAQSRATRSE